jgi:hypothetical protein
VPRPGLLEEARPDADVDYLDTGRPVFLGGCKTDQKLTHSLRGDVLQETAEPGGYHGPAGPHDPVHVLHEYGLAGGRR